MKKNHRTHLVSLFRALAAGVCVNALLCWGSFGQAGSGIPFAELGALSPDSGDTWVARIFDERINDGVQLVGLGEVSHGAYEPLAVKAKMVRYLVEKRGYRNVLFEFPDLAYIQPIRAYLLDQNVRSFDTADTLVKRIGALPVAAGVLCGLVRWLKHYNLAHPDKMVSVSGFDLHKDAGFRNYFLYGFLIPHDHEGARQLMYQWSNPGLSDSAKVMQMHAWFSAHRNRLEKSVAGPAFEELQYYLRNELHSVRYMSATAGDAATGRDKEAANIYRDSIMADNVARLAGTWKTAVWAHNGHVYPGVPFMGERLRQRYQSRYYIVLTDFSGRAEAYVQNRDKLPGDAGYNYREEFLSAPSATARMLMQQHGTASGVFFRQDLEGRIATGRLNAIDSYGRHVLLDSPGAFDALIVFPGIHATDKLSQIE